MIKIFYPETIKMKTLWIIAIIFFIGLLFFLYQYPEKYLTRVDLKNVTFKDDGSRKSMTLALERQISFYKKLLKGGHNRTWVVENLQYTTKDMLNYTQRFKYIYETSLNMKELGEKLEKDFCLYRFNGRDGGLVLLTGYFTPIIKGSRKKTKKFKYPIYRLPDDLYTVNLSDFNIGVDETIVVRVDKDSKKILPYYTREEIDWNGALSGKNLEMLYLENYMDQFILHIQGGGILELDGGQRTILNYAGKNGRDYFSIGKTLIRDGKITRDRISLQAIRNYFQEHPDEIRKYTKLNSSYVFYSEGKNGPIGSLGIAVTNTRTIATDKKIFTGGLIAYISGNRSADKTSFDLFAIDQDTGSAIKENHIDLYCGIGPGGEKKAGYMKDYASVFFLLPRKIAPGGL